MSSTNECGHRHPSARRHALIGFAVPALATGLIGLTLPLTTGSAAAADGSFGYSSLTVAAPVYVEIYEPTIPIPASPQAEMQFGYTKVVADSTSSRGRASFLWPGDAVGEGLKTIVENLGLPPEVAAPIAEQGYPVQVNSGFPSGPEAEADEPIPGSVMRTGATETATYAQAGYSSTCDTSGPGGGDSEGDGGTSPIPGLPDLPIPLLLDQLTSLLGTSNDRSATTSRSSFRSAAAEEPAECQIPAQIGALASFGGFSSSTDTQKVDGKVTTTARSAVGDISLAGGLVTMSGVTSKIVASSDGGVPEGKGKASYGTITIAGQTFGIGPDGIEAAGTPTAIPGLPDEPKDALKQLGITLTIPEPVFEQDGKELKGATEGLIVEIDTKTLFDAVRLLPLNDILDQLPEEMGDLKKALGAAVNLSPRVVLHLGRATAKLETVDPIKPPTVEPSPTESASPTGGTGGGGTGTGGLGTTTTPPGTTPLAPTGGEAPVGDLEDAVLASGLPPLGSIPFLAFLLGAVGATVAGVYAKRLGAAAMGAGGACSHGLDSGLPDLRKANQ